ncbi:MAG: sulfur carrier protein [Actinomycetota bacterium]|jgi:sulfur carrier protein
MTVIVNGRPLDVPDSLTINALLAQLDLTQRVAAVEHNGAALAASERDAVVLRDGDRIELVRATAGG